MSSKAIVISNEKMVESRVAFIRLFIWSSIILLLYSCNKIDNGIVVDPTINPDAFTDYDSVCDLDLFIPLPDISSITKETWVDSCKMIATSHVGVGKSNQFNIKIKGRGNSTWNRPKKPYTIKFYKKNSLFELPEHKTWVLLANDFDLTQMRNSIAFFMGHKLSKLEYTPRYHYANLTMNGEPWGLYMVGEKIEVGENRVCNNKDGYLIEVDGKAQDDEVLFNTHHMNEPLNIKEPKVEVGDDNYNYIVEYISNAENALFSNSFSDPDSGFRKFIDESSFVEWYLINEIAKNIDAAMYTSCYMSLTRGGKLKMGPIWDFDLAFGNYVFGTQELRDSLNAVGGLWVRQSAWYTRLFEDPVFYDNVVKRFNDYYCNRHLIYRYIDKKVRQLKRSVLADNKKWGRLGAKDIENQMVYDRYIRCVESLKVWIENRFEYLNSQYSDYEYYKNKN